jgi:uncharacterized repeat protein (TIGR03803 family)
MIRTKVTRTFTLAGFVPTGKSRYANRQERFKHATRNPREGRSRSTHSPQRACMHWLACALAALAIAPALAQTTYPNGTNPKAGVIRDSVGNLYGTTESGGAESVGSDPYCCGVVYKLDPTGNEKVLYSFKGTPDAATPQTGLIADSEGNLYGTTINGGTAGSGAVYKLDRAGRETVLYRQTQRR